MNCQYVDIRHHFWWTYAIFCRLIFDPEHQAVHSTVRIKLDQGGPKTVGPQGAMVVSILSHGL